MTIAIPVFEDNRKICVSFGRSPEFVLVNLDTMEKQYLENPAVDAQGGAGIKAAGFLVDQNIDVVVTPRLGENAAEVFASAGIQIMESTSDEVDQEIQKYMSNQLKVLSRFHAGFHGKQPS